MSTPRLSRPSDGFRVLDQRGCLTLEVLCFADQLTPDQRGAVDRHTRSCSLCAQQQTALARAADRFRRARPRAVFPPEVRLLARQAALRTGIARRQRASTTARLPIRGRRSAGSFYRSRNLWIALLAGLGAALLVTLLAFLLL